MRTAAAGRQRSLHQPGLEIELRDYAGEDRRANPLVGPERGETALPSAIADQGVVVAGHRGGGGQPDEIPGAVAQLPADHGEDGERRGIAEHHRDDVEAAEGNGCGANADLEVVLAVD